EQLHQAAFAHFHVDNQPRTDAGVKTFLAKHGIDESRYEKVLNSFAVHVKEAHYEQLQKRYAIGSTPTLIVNGRYRVEKEALQSAQELVELVRFLLTNP